MTIKARNLLSRLSLAFGLVLSVSAGANVTATRADNIDPENTLVLQLESGTVTIAMRPDLAPGHVARIKRLVREKFYDGVPFHRVIEGFMAQTGDPTGTGSGGSDYPDLVAEFSDAPHREGVVSMARRADPDSANSQWFITFAPAKHLDGQYTVWGQVIDGMEHVHDIKKGAPGSGTVSDPDRIVNMRVLADTQ